MAISDFEGLICPACSNPIPEESLGKLRDIKIIFPYLS